MPIALVHYHELALKGRNRGFFEQRLIHHLRSALKGAGVTHIDALPGRIRIAFPEQVSWDMIRWKLAHTFGIANFSLAHYVPLSRSTSDLSALCEAIASQTEPASFHTFRVTTKRAEKRFPKTSLEINREIGAYLCQKTGKSVSLGNPDLHIIIEILKDEAYFSLTRERGPGGLPMGISGQVLVLISGGIDSPVAAYRMMKRGCRVVFVHFHGRPYLSRDSEEKVRELVDLLTHYQLFSKLYLIPFGDIQRQIVLDAPASLRVVLYRRMMMRIAQELAKKEQCWSLITGDSLGQVASQTPENLQVVSQAAAIPILRPLIGMDKIEITEQAQRIGTFEISIEPDQDCCTLFIPPHPSTRSRLEYVESIEGNLDVASMLNQGIDKAEVVEFHLHEKLKKAAIRE